MDVSEILIIVHYRFDHSIHNEWVYNRADIDNSRIVWAREMGPPDDQPLIRYYGDRHIWLLDADAPQPKLIPYGSSSPLSRANRYDP